MAEYIISVILIFGVSLWMALNCKCLAETYRKQRDDERAKHKETLKAWKESDEKQAEIRAKTFEMYRLCYERMHYFEKLYYDSQKRLPGDEWKRLL